MEFQDFRGSNIASSFLFDITAREDVIPRYECLSDGPSVIVVQRMDKEDSADLTLKWFFRGVQMCSTSFGHIFSRETKYIIATREELSAFLHFLLLFPPTGYLSPSDSFRPLPQFPGFERHFPFRPVSPPRSSGLHPCPFSPLSPAFSGIARGESQSAGEQARFLRRPASFLRALLCGPGTRMASPSADRPSL